ncbi:hypothetical protein R6Q59_009880 [Mikania micrantha]
MIPESATERFSLRRLARPGSGRHLITPPSTMSKFDSIPTIDLALALSPATQRETLDCLIHAITSVGFLYIKNHGVPLSVINDLKDLLPELFNSSSTTKNEIALANSPHFLGYGGAGSETTAGKTDEREQFEFATELTEKWTTGKPLWERLRDLINITRARSVIEIYIRELSALSDRFLILVADALSLPKHIFLPFVSDQHRLKLVHYSASQDTATQGVGPHKDSSEWWTFLLQASSPEVGGLQALNQAGQWIDVPNVPDTFVVNIGQAFEVVTHGYCKATTHRVLSTQAERYSVPFFQGVRRSLTKHEALGLAEYFPRAANESEEGASIDSAFLRGKYDTWGESQLRTKIRSHRGVGKTFYADVFEKYINDRKER